MAVLSSYKENRETYIAWNQAVAGLGALIGPMLGALLYTCGGYKAPFYCIGGFYLSMVLYFLANTIKNAKDTVQENDLQEPLFEVKETKQKRVLSFCEIMSVARSGFGIFGVFVCYFVFSYNTPILNNHFLELKYSPAFFGAAISMAAFSFAIAMPLINKMTSKMNRRGVIFLGLVVQVTGVLITGLDECLGYYNPGVYVVVGLSVFGFGTAMVAIPIMPEVLEGIENIHSDYDEFTLENNVSGYYVTFQGVGETMGPMTSSIIEKSLEFQMT